MIDVQTSLNVPSGAKLFPSRTTTLEKELFFLLGLLATRTMKDERLWDCQAEVKNKAITPGDRAQQWEDLSPGV